MNGVIVIDKPQDFTSFDVVAVMRRLCGQKKIGHTGTLDPMATGVLPLLLGNATKAQELLPDSNKEYLAQFKLGITTDTLDITGKVLTTTQNICVTAEQIEKELEKYRGNIMQIPPMYSAVKKDGRRLYDLARKGIEVQREARPINIGLLELVSYNAQTGQGVLKVQCSKGTYIRSLVDDIGYDLKTGAVLTELKRTFACGFTLEDAVTLEEFKEIAEKLEQESRLRSTQSLFKEYKEVKVTPKQTQRFRNGGGLDISRTPLKNSYVDKEIYRVLSDEGKFLGLGIIDKEKRELSIYKLFLE